MFTAPADWYLASVLGMDPTFHRAPAGPAGRVRPRPRRRGHRAWRRAISGPSASSPGCSPCAVSPPASRAQPPAFRASSTWSATCSTCTTARTAGRSGCTAPRSASPRWSPRRPGSTCSPCSTPQTGPRSLASPTPRPSRPGGPACSPRSPTSTPPARSARNAGATTPPSSPAGAPGGTPSCAAFAEWDRHRAAVDELLVDSDTLAAGLVAAGAAARFTDLDPAVDRGHRPLGRRALPPHAQPLHRRRPARPARPVDPRRPGHRDGGGRRPSIERAADGP